MLRRLSLFITTVIIWQLTNSVTLARSNDPQQADSFPPSPLEITTPDPLVPTLRDKQQLTVAEQQKLEAALDELNQQATAKLQAGDNLGAFEIWNRELRLRRYLGAVAEVQALSRVGEIAWNQNDRQELQYITQRLQAIQKQAQPQNKNVQHSVDLPLLQALGEAYQKVRSLKSAITVYNEVLATVREKQDLVAQVNTLTTIGELNLNWFDYPQAATAYEELLRLATSGGENQNQQEFTYLQKLAYIYQQSKQAQKSIDVLNKIKAIYSQNNNFTQLPTLQLAIAANYEILARENPALIEAAFKNYQEAYITAWQLQQYPSAAEAVQKLISLYRSQGQLDEALQASEILLEIQTRAVNFYGLMEAYDQIGKLYLERKDSSAALAAFQKGLELARQLKHQEAYFTQQINSI
ncbi:tetratricopeptide repeat protein [Anabaena sp. CCY 9910]|uniref:tetratricopeptide repeat protein n=1 Tax=Anabaena sp. CCY 9910 TaxID=3103870 RepID=UPI0039DF70A9